MKKITAVFLCLVICFGICSCGKSNSASATDETTAPEPILFDGEKKIKNCYEADFLYSITSKLYSAQSAVNFVFTLHSGDVLEKTLCSVYSVWNSNERLAYISLSTGGKAYLCTDLDSDKFFYLTVDGQSGETTVGDEVLRDKSHSEAAPYEYAQKNKLSKEGQTVYDDIYGKIKSLKPFLISAENNGSEAVALAKEAVTAVMADHPETYNYFLPDYGYKNNERISVSSKYYLCSDYQNDVAADEIKKEINEFESVCDNIIELMPEYLSDYEKYMYLVLSLCKLCDYKNGSSNIYLVRSPYGALVNGGAICEGYSRAYQYLCSKANLYCTCVLGYAEIDHMWNAVNLGGQILYVDATWCDSSENNLDFFMLTKDEISKDHTSY